MPLPGITAKSLGRAGSKFNRLLCESVIWDEVARSAVGVFKCECGNRVVKPLSAVVYGGIKSCGCLARDALMKRNVKHGMCHTKIYDIWAEMIARCERPSHVRYADYGGRGLSVSPEWRSFERFYADMGERPASMSLERKNNDRGYSKENCVWAPMSRQNTNKRNNRYIEAFGLRLPITWWGQLIGMGSSALNTALKKHHLEDIVVRRVGSVSADHILMGAA